MTSNTDNSQHSGGQFELLRKRRFLPLFVTQFLGAFNDNIFKNALILLVTYQLTTSLDTSLLVNLAAGLFILPFFLFSATAGQLADKHEKSQLIRRIKLCEIGIMMLGAVGIYLGNVYFLLTVLFLMGTQSTFFGPIKYGILPQHLRANELVGGNGLIEMGTFLSILAGTLLGGVLISMGESGRILVCLIVIIVALSGWLCSRQIPAAVAVDSGIDIDKNVIAAITKGIRHARENYNVFLAIMGISWFWFFGAIYLAQFPLYTKEVLFGDETVATLLLTAFSIGIGLGSLVCERLSRRRVEIGLVPIGSIGMTVFGLHLAFFAQPTIPADSESLWTAISFLSQSGSFRVLLDLLLVSFFAGMYIVPLYAYVQSNSRSSHRSRVIAANNIINALFMVVAAALGALLLSMGLSIPQLFLVVALMNVAIAIYIYTLSPEFILRLISWVLVHTIYRLRKVDLHQLPDQGAAVLISNHVSFVDALIINAVSPRPIRFVMDANIFAHPLLGFLFRTARAIPISSGFDNADLLRKAYDEIETALKNNELVCIFPEGKLTLDGEISPFKKGIEKIISRTPVAVIPLALRGLWGSLFSRKHKSFIAGLPGKLWARIEVVCGPPIAPEQAGSVVLQAQITKLRGNMP